MDIENNIFRNYIPDYDKLKKYGFILKKNNYYTEKLFKNGAFKAVIKINPRGEVIGKVYDIENGDEFLPLRIVNHQGAFVNEMRCGYDKILYDIRDNCFTKTYFMFPQSNRITQNIIKEYGDMPEFLWEKFKGCGIFRNSDSKKWYAAILDTAGTKFQLKNEAIVEVINIKLSPEHIQGLLKQPHFYPAYHMNKKNWITVVLDETICDDMIMKLVYESHSLTIKRKNINVIEIK